MKDLYIIGAGGFGREVAWLVRRINSVRQEWNIKGFIDDDNSLLHRRLDGYEVIGNCDYLKEMDTAYAVCAIGNPAVRQKIVGRLTNVKFATLIDPSVIMSDSVEIGEGTVICAGTIITVDVTIGDHVLINLDCTIGHDDILDDYVTLCPSVNVSGCVHLKEGVEMGTGSQIIQGLNVEGHSIIGAGGVVVKDITERGTYVGVPVRKVK